MIHCDEVFDILTRGPFPTGAASDGIVESHLAHCDDCRRLAEALRPAIELFQEAITPDESRTLPSYWGEPRTDQGPASRPALRLGRSAPPSPSSWPEERAPSKRSLSWHRAGRRLRGWLQGPGARFAAAVLLGAALAGVGQRLGAPFLAPQSTSSSTAAGHTDGAAAVGVLAGSKPSGGGDLVALAGMLPAACLEPPFSRATLRLVEPAGDSPAANPAAEALQVACCTCCHSYVGRGRVPTKAIDQIARTCAVCH